MCEDFEKLRTTRLANYTEPLIDDYLYKTSGSILAYGPQQKTSHPLDRFYFNKNNHSFFLADIKCKERRNKYPDYGIDTKDYWKYKSLRERFNLSFYIFYIDYRLGNVYFGELADLEKEVVVWNDYYKRDEKYPKIEQWCTYFPVENMKFAFRLSEEQLRELQAIAYEDD
jgi:hypothetical protein